MKVAVCRKVVDKSKDFETLATGFENLELTQEELAREINAGHAFTTWHTSRRKQENFTVGGYIALDFDKATPGDVERLAEDEFTKSHFGIFYYTPSSTDDNPRFRLLFELETEITDPTFYRDAVQALIWSYNEWGAVADTSCKDPTRFFYGSKDSNPFFTGKILPDAVLAALVEKWRAEQAAQAAVYARGNKVVQFPGVNSSNAPKLKIDPEKEIARKKKYINKVIEGSCTAIRNAQKGERHGTLLRRTLIISGYLAGEPGIVSEYDVISALESAYSVHPDLNTREMRSTISWALEKGANRPIAVPERKEVFTEADFDLTWKAIKEADTEIENEIRQIIDEETGEILEPETTPQTKQTAKTYSVKNTTDMGNAERLVERFGDRLRYVHAWGWMAWNGKFWEMDKNGMAQQFAKKTVRTIYQEAASIEDDSQRLRIAKWATTSESAGKIEAMLSVAESDENLRLPSTDFDKDTMLLNVENGTINLRTGEIKPHDKNDLITKIAPVNFDKDAKCPTWEKFLAQIMDNSEELIKFLQRAFGYSLTADNTEQCFFLCYGTGQNGKSTMIETIRTLLGDYAQAANFETFLEKRGEGPRNDIAKLVGTRFVSAAEPDMGKNISESIIKQLTGNDMIAARLLYKEEFNFRPSFKIFLAANHKPGVRGQDKGIWRRIKLVPFDVTIEDNQKDRHLPDKLRAELPGILNWAIQGCLEWQKNGLGEPEEITQATTSYKEESDRLRDFLVDCCSTKGRGAAAKSTEFKVLFKTYNSYCEEAGDRPLNKQSFAQAITERGYLIRTGHANKRYVFGISLLDGIGQGQGSYAS